MVKVESFELDHTKVIAPYVRKCSTLVGEKGDIVTKYDLRFIQPNEGGLPTGAIHTLEHLMAGYVREKLEGVIDISPMGCRTGFYMITWRDIPEKQVADALTYSLKKIIETDEIPATNKVQCGNYKDHSLFAAKEYAKEILEKGIRDKAF